MCDCTCFSIYVMYTTKTHTSLAEGETKGLDPQFLLQINMLVVTYHDLC